MKLNGRWKGEYRYELEEHRLKVQPIMFSANFRQSILGRLRGVIQDNPPGLPDESRLEGRLRGTHVFFRKIPAQFYTISEDGLRLVGEYIEETFGEKVRGDPPAPHVHYHGEWAIAGERVEGVWHIPSYLLTLKGSKRQLMFQETRGTWWMEHVHT